MPSIIPGYQYDIFISYRQKDNLPAPGGNGWVTDFVQALKNELESVFKEDIAIYFDINPHDGLHESHDVDGSLEEKIKCLVFIPVLSRTYCDTKSFAWSKELLPFLDFAKNDGHGLKVKLAGGNVAGRVLPQHGPLFLPISKIVSVATHSGKKIMGWPPSRFPRNSC